MSPTPSRPEWEDGTPPDEGRSPRPPWQDTTLFSPEGSSPPTGPTACPLPPDLADHPRYRVLEFLGAGGMGAVFKAEHRLMGRVVALKVINHRLTDSPSAVARFRREVQAAARLSHPYIVHAYDADQAGATHFLVMEYVPGVDLRQLLQQRGPLPVDRACDYARQAAVGLQHAHEQGMVHRDIKPHNLMLTPQGQVKILDFGLARFASEAGPPEGGGAALNPGAAAGGLTSYYRGLGTVDYLAPEEARDARQADIRGDIYSLGCTLYHLLSGRVPFADGTVQEKLRCHAERSPTPLAELRPEVPEQLAGLVARMLAKEPGGRPQTPAEVAHGLAPFAGSVRSHILVVDDDPAGRDALKRALEMEGYTVACAANGQEALDRLRTAPPPGLILLDLLMPVMDGWQFLHERQRDAGLAAIPVVIISAADAGQAMGAGAADYLRKPVELAELVAKIQGHTG